VKKHGKKNVRILVRHQVDSAIIAGYYRGPFMLDDEEFN